MSALQGSKKALVRSYLGVPEAAGHVKNFDISSENYIFFLYDNIFCDAVQVPILRNLRPALNNTSYAKTNKPVHYKNLQYATVISPWFATLT